jgi:hypothetical protein
MREVQVGIELGSDPDFAGFNPVMISGSLIDKIRFLSVWEVELDVCKERWLVSFDGEVMVGVTFLNQVMGEVALSQEGVGCNSFALHIDGIKERGWPS